MSFQSRQIETYNVSITYQGVSMWVDRIVNLIRIAKYEADLIGRQEKLV